MVKVAIFHEGNAKKTHDNELLQLLIEELSLPLENVKFVGMGTKSNFFKQDNDNYKELLLDIRRKAIQKALLVVDADYPENDSIYGGAESTQRELEKILIELNLNEKVDIYVTCDPIEQNGYLESLILSTIPESDKNCIEDFLDCSDFKSKENHKAILNQIYKIAYPKAPFDFNHPNFNTLKTKLQTLFEGIA